VTAARSCKRKAGILVHTSRAIHPDDRDEVDGIPLTSVARTIVDLAGRLGDSAVARVLNEAEVRQLLDVAAVEAALGRVPGARGRPRLVAALANYSEAPGYAESEAERLLRRLCRRHGLPQPGRVFHSGCELDFYWPDAQLAIEVDGHAFHSTRRAFHDDRRRDRLLATKGIQVVRVTWNDLARRPGELALELSDVRARRLT
jgi:very-short-patch-repair endonuclease